LFEDKAGAGRPYREAEKDVHSRLVEIATEERTLRTWRVTDDEIAAIHMEADRLSKADELHETRMPAADLRNWARVEVRAPRSGVILEKNVALGDIVDTDTNLFMIGDLANLSVWAHVYEEDLPLLEALPRPIHWTVTLPSRPGDSFSGTLEKIGAVIDPAQHTALVTGHVENGTANLKVGQFVSVTVLLPPPKDELEVPATSVVEDNADSIVFVQPVAREHRFVRKPVSVVRRFRDTVYLKVTDTGVKPGQQIVTSGALLLQNAMNQLPASAQSLSHLQADSSIQQHRENESKREPVTTHIQGND
jgi:cobalt-zinc-cadmium efflux system membrane fusion protein